MFRVSQLGQHPGLGVVCFRPHCPILKRAVAGFEVVQLSRGETARRGRTQSPSTCHRAALGNLPVIENAITLAPRFPLGKKQRGRASRNPSGAPQETEPTPPRLAAPVLIRPPRWRGCCGDRKRGEPEHSFTKADKRPLRNVAACGNKVHANGR